MSLGDYLARRERALDYLALWLASDERDVSTSYECDFDSDPRMAWYLADHLRGAGAPPPRDRAPLPLP